METDRRHGQQVKMEEGQRRGVKGVRVESTDIQGAEGLRGGPVWGMEKG